MSGERSRRRAAQRGASILDALLGFAVVVGGMVGSARLQIDLRLAADLARQRAEAVRLAQQQIEQLRSAAALDPGATTVFVDDDAGANERNARFEVERSLGAADDASPLRQARVRVAWADRRGHTQALRIDTLLAPTAPALGAAPMMAAAGRPVAPLQGRHIGIPAEAADLGDGRSAFKPALGGDAVWLLDNPSGRITARCSGAAAVRSSRDLHPADLGACEAVEGLLLSGRIRFAGLPAPLAAGVSLPGAGSEAAECVAEAVKVVAYRVGAGDASRREALPIGASAEDHRAASWSELGDRHLRYHCRVTPAAGDGGRRWSGRTVLAADGWRIGELAGERRVCRLTAEAGELSRDANAAHPERYVDVSRALVEQNFLVVDAAEACPVAGPTNLTTVQHQP